jgi:hypothetical protein
LVKRVAAWLSKNFYYFSNSFEIKRQLHNKIIFCKVSRTCPLIFHNVRFCSLQCHSYFLQELRFSHLWLWYWKMSKRGRPTKRRRFFQTVHPRFRKKSTSECLESTISSKIFRGNFFCVMVMFYL